MMGGRLALHRWLFADKNGKEMKFSQKTMPFAVFKHNAVWGGVCTIGDIKCRIKIWHNSEGEKGKRLEVRFPHEELGKVVPIDKTTLVGYIGIQGSFQKGTGTCVFQTIKERIGEEDIELQD